MGLKVSPETMDAPPVTTMGEDAYVLQLEEAFSHVANQIVAERAPGPVARAGELLRQLASRSPAITGVVLGSSSGGRAAPTLAGDHGSRIAGLEATVAELRSSKQALELELAQVGGGSSKKVHAEEAFDDVDTDKDGKLAPKELGAMLQARGVVLSPKRTEMLLGALDEDGDGSLDLAEFSKSLELLAAVARALLKEQQPSQPAVAAGVVAVGSRLDKNNYVEEMSAWAREPQQLLPKAVLLQANVAAIQAIGPAYLQQHLEQQQIDELTKAVEALKEADNISARTRAEYQLAEAKKRKEKVDAKLAAAVAHINAVKLASAEAISPGLACDGERYTEALTKLVADEPGVLDEVSAEAAAMVNSGALKVGDEVEVVEGSAMQRAKVRRVVDQGEGNYELSLWTEVLMQNHKFEAGFDTSKPKLVTLLRRGIYANTKHKQALTPIPIPIPNPIPNPHSNP